MECRILDYYCTTDPCTVDGLGACQTWAAEECIQPDGTITYRDYFVQCNCTPGTNCW